MKDKYTCPHCKEKIDLDKKDLHNNYCLHTPKNEEFDDLIPCEFCNSFISFGEYAEHTAQCGLLNLGSRTSFTLNPVYNVVGNNNTSTSLNTLSSLSNLFTSINNRISSLNNLSNLNNLNNSNNESSNINLIDSSDEQIPNLNLNYFFNSINNINSLGELNNIENISENQTHENEHNLNLNYDDLDNEFPSVNTILSNLNINFQDIDDLLENMNTSEQSFTFNLNTGDTYSDLTNLSEEIGDVEIGIQDIEKVSEIIEKTELCPICREDVKKVRKTICNHFFCDDCLRTWLSNNKTCPICLKDLSE